MVCRDRSFMHRLYLPIRVSRLTAAVERHNKRIETDYPGVRSVESFEEMLRMDEIELIVVNTPDATHFDMCRRALEAGKHVIVEKPFVASTSEAETLIEMAEKRGLLLTVYQNRRWDNDFLTVRKIIDSRRARTCRRIAVVLSAFSPCIGPVGMERGARTKSGRDHPKFSLTPLRPSRSSVRDAPEAMGYIRLSARRKPN